MRSYISANTEFLMLQMVIFLVSYEEFVLLRL